MKKKYIYSCMMILLTSLYVCAHEQEICSDVDVPCVEEIIDNVAVKDINSAYAGRLYYDALLQSAIEKHWLIQASVGYTFASSGFGGCSQAVPLSNVIFGADVIRLRDILMLSKLSDENKITIFAELNSNLPADRPAYVGVSSVGVPVGNNVIGLPIIQSFSDPTMFQFPPDFGAFRSDQYLAQLANMTLEIKAQDSYVYATVDSIYYFDIPHTQYKIACGFEIPFVSAVHRMTVNFNNVANHLYDSQAQSGPFISAPFVDLANPASVTPFFPPETALSSFQASFADLTDFFLRGVLEQKCMQASLYDRKTGLGDISAYILADASRYFAHLDGLSVSLNVVFPSGNKQTGERLWEIELGNGGAYQVDLNGNVLFRTPSNLLNPAFSFAVEWSKEFEGMRRIAKRKILTTATTLSDIPDLVIPADSLDGFVSRPYDTYDSSISDFADQAVPAHVKYGNSYFASIGNYFYGLFGLNVSLGLFYDYTYKEKDCVRVAKDSCTLPCPAISLDGNWDTQALENGTQQRMQRVGWEFVYEANNSIQLSCGTINVVQGLNVERWNEFFVSLVANF